MSIYMSRRSTLAEKLTVSEIKSFMKQHGISEKEMSEIFGVTTQAVRLWVLGQREFTVTNSRLVRLFIKHPGLLSEF